MTSKSSTPNSVRHSHREHHHFHHNNHKKKNDGNGLLLETDPNVNSLFQRIVTRNLSISSGVEIALRNHVLGAINTNEDHDIVTTSEFKAKLDGERDAIVVIEKAKLNAQKMSEDEYKPKMEHEKAKVHRKKVIEKPASKPKGQKVKPIERKWRPVVKEDEEPTETRFVSLWEKYENEGPPEVDCGFEVAPSPQRPPAWIFTGPKTYNVSVQIRPKDIARVTVGPDAEDILRLGKYKVLYPTEIPEKKMMNVSLQVRQKDKSAVASTTDTSEIETEAFKNAMTLARPRGYNELYLNTSIDTMSLYDKEIQANELEIEKEIALLRGVAIRDGEILWPTIMEFTPELSIIKIETYIRNFWKLSPQWLHDIRFINEYTTNYRKKFVFEVVYSVPTKESPVPPATASVFFVFEAQHYDCVHTPMNVTFIVEGNRYPYKPGRIDFQESWLSNIIHDKLKVQREFQSLIKTKC